MERTATAIEIPSNSRPSVTDEDYSGQHGGNCLNHGLIGLRRFHGLKASDG